jgi:hypothetical protein
MVYALLPDKTEISYTLVFKLIKGFVPMPPSSVMTDFEKAALNAIRQTLIECTIQGCYFHLTSNNLKHVNSNGLSSFYSEPQNVEFRNNFKWLKSLEFVPTNCVLFAFKKLKDIAEVKFKPSID